MKSPYLCIKNMISNDINPMDCCQRNNQPNFKLFAIMPLKVPTLNEQKLMASKILK